jgi:hypothetical protein
MADSPNKLTELPEPGILFTRADAEWAYHALKDARNSGLTVPEQDELCDELRAILWPPPAVRADDADGLTATDRAARLAMVEWIRASDEGTPGSAKMTYSVLAGLVPQAGWKPRRWTGIGTCLDRINRYMAAHGLPLISVIVHPADFSWPRTTGGFYDMARSLGRNIPVGTELAFAAAELEAVVDYWKSDEGAATLAEFYAQEAAAAAS